MPRSAALAAALCLAAVHATVGLSTGTADVQRTWLRPPAAAASARMGTVAPSRSSEHPITELKVASLRGGGGISRLRIGQYFTIMYSAVMALTIAMAPMRFLKAYESWAINPVPNEGTPSFDLLVLIMKWFALKVSNTAVIHLVAIFTDMPEKCQKDLLLWGTIWSVASNSFLTVFGNYNFSAKISGGNVKMDAIVKMLFTQLVHLGVTFYAIQ